MITAEEIHSILTQAMPGAEITVADMTGTSDHWEVIVIWEQFSGKSLVEQHQTINRALEAPLNDGRIHALKMKTLAPQS